VVRDEAVGMKYHSKRLNTLVEVCDDNVEILKADGKTEWLRKKRISNARITTKHV